MSLSMNLDVASFQIDHRKYFYCFFSKKDSPNVLNLCKDNELRYFNEITYLIHNYSPIECDKRDIANFENREDAIKAGEQFMKDYPEWFI